MKLGLQVVLLVAVVVPSLSEGRTVSRCELKEMLGEAIALPEHLQRFKERILAIVICEVNRRSRLNTSLVRVFGRCRTTTASSTTASTTLTTTQVDETTTEATTLEATTTEATTLEATTLEEATTEATTTEVTTLAEATTLEATTTEATTTEATTLAEATTLEATTTEATTTEATTLEATTPDASSSTLEPNPPTTGRRKREADTTSEEFDNTELKELMIDEHTVDEEVKVTQDDAMIGDEDEESDEEVEATQDEDMIGDEDEESDEEGKAMEDDDSTDEEVKAMQDDDMIGAEDEEIDKWDREKEEDDEEVEESGKRKKRSFRGWWRRPSLGLYGLFQLSDKTFCNSGYRRSKDVCQTSCEAFTDDNITDDIECFVKTNYWRLLLKFSSRQCHFTRSFFDECE